jgi:hypothetical protein
MCQIGAHISPLSGYQTEVLTTWRKKIPRRFNRTELVTKENRVDELFRRDGLKVFSF